MKVLLLSPRDPLQGFCLLMRNQTALNKLTHYTPITCCHEAPTMLLRNLGMAVMLMSCTREVRGSNVRQDTE
jgi:hypothetical protein